MCINSLYIPLSVFVVFSLFFMFNLDWLFVLAWHVLERHLFLVLMSSSHFFGLVVGFGIPCAMCNVCSYQPGEQFCEVPGVDWLCEDLPEQQF